jgi:hypothetical protein
MAGMAKQPLDRCTRLKADPLLEQPAQWVMLGRSANSDYTTLREYAALLVDALSPSDPGRPRGEALCVAMLERLRSLPCGGSWSEATPVQLEDLACIASMDPYEMIPSLAELRDIFGEAGFPWAEANVRADWGDAEKAEQLLAAVRLFDPDAKLEPRSSRTPADVTPPVRTPTR